MRCPRLPKTGMEVNGVAEESRLEKMLRVLEYDRRIRISVLPLGKNALSREGYLPTERVMHTHPYCEQVKRTRIGVNRCMACKSLAVKKAVETGKPFGGTCIQGAWEAVCPVIKDGTVQAVVFVGGLLPPAEHPEGTPDSRARTGRTDPAYASLLQPMSEPSGYLETAQIVADYLLTLSVAYPAYPPHEREVYLPEAVMRYADTYYTGEISLKRLASIFYMNEKYLGRLFKKHTGMAFSEYVNRKRLEKEANLLEQTLTPIIGVAMDCGFNNVTYFYRLFSRCYGMSPAAYRKKRKGTSN